MTILEGISLWKYLHIGRQCCGRDENFLNYEVMLDLKEKVLWRVNDTSKAHFLLWPAFFMSAILSAMGVASYSCLRCRNLAANHDASSLCLGTEILKAIKASFFHFSHCLVQPGQLCLDSTCKYSSLLHSVSGTIAFFMVSHADCTKFLFILMIRILSPL